MVVSRGVAGLAYLGGCGDDEYRVFVRRREEHMKWQHQVEVWDRVGALSGVCWCGESSQNSGWMTQSGQEGRLTRKLCAGCCTSRAHKCLCQALLVLTCALDGDDARYRRAAAAAANKKTISCSPGN